MTSLSLTKGNVPAVAPEIGEIVRVWGPVKNYINAEMIGVLSGVTWTEASIIVYMEFGQSTTFQRTGHEAVQLERV